MNDPLRQALANAQITAVDLAEQLGVDPKTVQRWLAGRTPYPRNRADISALVDIPEADLWPDLALNLLAQAAVAPDVLATYAHRWAVPREEWQRLFRSARSEIGILVYAGLFLAEDVGIQRVLADQARHGVRIRVLLGDPDSPRVAERGSDEGVDDAIAAKIRNALVLYRPLAALDGVEVRLHATTLYTSIYRADDEIMINPHLYGVAAAQAPVLHTRKSAEGDMASTYLDIFERIWGAATRA